MQAVQKICAATQEIFDMMLGAEVHPQDPEYQALTTLENSVSGILGLSGDFQGVLSLHCPYPAARSITCALLGLSADEVEIDEDVKDAVGEMANMIAGGLKSAWSQEGCHIDISVPTTVGGAKYSLNCLSRADCVIIPFRFEASTFFVEFKYLVKQAHPSA